MQDPDKFELMVISIRDLLFFPNETPFSYHTRCIHTLLLSDCFCGFCKLFTNRSKYDIAAVTIIVDKAGPTHLYTDNKTEAFLSPCKIK